MTESLGEHVLTAENAIVDGDLEKAEDALTKALGEVRKRKSAGVSQEASDD